MAALITTAIPVQNFELVRDTIGSILLTELTNQKALQDFDEDIVVYQERVIPMQTDENLYFNVLLDSATYGNYTTKDQQGRTIFFIDVYATGVHSSSKPGSVDAGDRMGRFLGMAMYILRSDKYKLLGMPLGVIGGTYIESFATSEPTQFESGTFSRFGRISFAVRIQENNDLWNAIALDGNDSKVTLETTNKGYVYTFNT